MICELLQSLDSVLKVAEVAQMLQDPDWFDCSVLQCAMKMKKFCLSFFFFF